MMTRIARANLVRRGAAGAATFVYFVLLALPTLTFSAGLAVDFTRIIIATRQVNNAAQAAALSGAQQFIANTQYIDAQGAKAAAERTYCVAITSGATSLSSATGGAGISCPGGSAASIEVTTIDAGYQNGVAAASAVNVHASFHVTGLVFTNFWGMGSTFDPAPVDKSAQVCVPGDNGGPTNGFCAHARRG